MYIVCSKEKLSENINIVSKAVSNRSTMQVLECILIKADQNGIKMSASDLEMGIETDYIEAEIIREGTVAIEARLFSDIVRKMPDGDLHIQADNNFVTIIKCQKVELKILGINGDEFPSMPRFEKNDCISLPAYKLKNMIRQTVFSVSTDESKPVFTGELMHAAGGYLKLVSVDGFRISYRRDKCAVEREEGEEDASVTMKAVIPGRTMNEISKILPSDGDEIVNIYATGRHMLFEMKRFTVLSRLLEGEFLDYERMLSSDFRTRIGVERAELTVALERALLISRDSVKNPVVLKIEQDRMVITSNTEAGTSYDEVPIEKEGEDITISFNPRYLADALKAIDDAKVFILFNSNISPCLILSPDGEGDYKYLVLPLRTWS